jgi:Na+/H+ antiporter NhaC
MSISKYRILGALLFIGCLFMALPSTAQQVAETLTQSSVSGTWLSILPPLIAIVLALVTRQVLFSIFISIWLGAYLVTDMSFAHIGSSFFDTVTDYLVPAVASEGHVSIILFSLLIGGMIGVITANGGTRGIIDLFTKFVKNRRQGQLTTAIMGCLIFFDDYANTMIVGNTMRPLTDKFRITRAKLAYLVDSTAAPIATIALVSTWIGAMVGYITDAEAAMGDYHEAAYLVFLNSLKYNFYAFMTIFFVFVIAISGKDFGPMLKARIRLLKAEDDPSLDRYNLWKERIEKDEEEQKKSHWINSVIPILVLIFGTIIGLAISGEGNSVQEIVATADSYAALLWGSLLSLSVALIMTFAQKLLDVEKMLEGMMKGMHTMFDGLIILVMAWSLSALTAELQTADYLVSVFNDSLNPYWLPAIIFVLAGITSFSTGSSWGTMGILMPLVVPLTWELGKASGLPFDVTHELIYGSVASVLAGSVWGDHCSPISDTTILSSIASQCDHIEHVRTQLPYAMVVGGLSIVSLISTSVLELPFWLNYVIFIPLIYLLITKFGNRAKDLNLDDYEFENSESL